MSSAGVILEVECDGCRKVEKFPAADRVHGDRLVDDAGWLRNKATDKDICPSCVATRAGYHVDRRLL